MTGLWLFVGLLAFNCLREFECDICKTCLCSNTDEDHIIDCHGKRMGIDIGQYDFSALMNQNITGEFVLSKNELTILPSNVMKTLENVKILDISKNSISEIPVYDIKDAYILKILNFSHNKLEQFDNTLMNLFPSLLKLDFSHNRINALNESTIEIKQHPLTYLNISHNNISRLPVQFFQSFNDLNELDLSFNKISSLNQSLIHLWNLKSLSIDNNRLISLNFQELPSSLMSLKIGYNMIENFNVQGNEINNLKLRVLDISYNYFNVLPKTISMKNFPSLSELNIDGNPIKEIKFFSPLKLRTLRASHLELLHYIENDSFSNIISSDEDCIDLIVSNNSNLNSIHEDAFTNLNFCFLNLRGNNLSYISSKLLKSKNGWRAIEGIDLQGNPFHCNCSLQWVLNDLVPFLHKTNQALLSDLRCANSHIRMVRWYEWEKQVFCDDTLTNYPMEIPAQMVKEEKVIVLIPGRGMIWSIFISVGLLSILVVSGLCYSNRMIQQRRRGNRKY